MSMLTEPSVVHEVLGRIGAGARMVYREIVSEAKRLPLHEQFLLVEELLRAMRQSAQAPALSKRKRVVPFKQLRGALKTEGPLPTDAALQDAYTEHLMEKYL